MPQVLEAISSSTYQNDYLQLNSYRDFKHSPQIKGSISKKIQQQINKNF
jgi:hypothetical protein